MIEYLAKFFLELESHKSCSKNQNTHFTLNTFFPLSKILPFMI